MIKAIIFDCFGVLTTDHWRTFVESIPSSLKAKKARELNHQYDAGLLSEEEFIEQVHQVTGRKKQEIAAVLDNEQVKNYELLQYIRELKQRGFVIGLLSNVASDWITTSFLDGDEQQLFDDMVLSYQVGMTKPDSQLYQLACDRFNLDPQQVVLIDDIDPYCEAARAEGMRAIQYQTFEQMRQELEKILTMN